MFGKDTVSLDWELKYDSLIGVFVLGCICVLLAVQLDSHPPLLPLFAGILSLFFSPRVQLMGCRKDGAPEPTVWIMRPVTEIPNYIPSVSLTC